MEYFFPINLISLSLIPRVIVGGVFLLYSRLFFSECIFSLIKNKTPFDTSKSTIKMVTDGAYRFSRNPLYLLAYYFLLFGFAILLSSLWLFCTIPILYTLFLFKAVKLEERYR